MNGLQFMHWRDVGAAFSSATIAIAMLVAFGCGHETNGFDAGKTARREIAPPSGERALALAGEFIGAAPSRDAGSDGAHAAADWIAGRLRASGLDARIDSFVDRTPAGALEFRNVVAEIAPPGPEAGWIVLLSHFDTKSGIPGFVGANDGASSTALLLEIAAAVANAGGDGAHGFVFAFLDGEECRVRYGKNDGLHGSRRLAGMLKEEGRRIRAVVLLDMVGDRDLLVTIPRNGDRALTLGMLAVADSCGLRDFFRAGEGGVLDDHQPFLDAGFPAIDLIDFKYGSVPGANDYWHTPQDTFDKLSAESLERVGRVVIRFIGAL